MNFNLKRKECSAKSFFVVSKLLKLIKINFITVKDQLEGTEEENLKAFRKSRGEIDDWIKTYFTSQQEKRQDSLD